MREEIIRKATQNKKRKSSILLFTQVTAEIEKLRVSKYNFRSLNIKK